MVKLQSVTIDNFHNVGHKMYRFDDMNYLIGSNGAGKSTVLQAVQLAILGYIPGYSKKANDIFKHANDPQRCLQVSVDLYDTDTSEDIRITRRWTLAKGTVSSETIISPETYEVDALACNTELPIYNFSPFVQLTANQLKDWFIKFAPAVDADIDWRTTLTEAIKGKCSVEDSDLQEILDWIESDPHMGVEKVQAVNRYLKTLKSTKNAEISRLQSTIQMLIHYDDFECEYSEDELISQMEALQKEKESCKEYFYIFEKNNSILADINALGVVCKYAEDDPKFQETSAQIKEIERQIDDLNTCISTNINFKEGFLTRRYTAVDKKTVVERLLESESVCPYSHKSCKDFDEYRTTLREEVDTANIEIEECNHEIDRLVANIEADSAKLADLRNKLTDLVSIQSKIKNKYAMHDILQSKLEPIPKIYTREDEAKIESEIAEKSELLYKVKANAKYQDMNTRMTSEMFKLEQLFEAIKIWASLTDVNGLQTKLMKAPFEALSNELSKWIKYCFGHDSVDAAFRLTEKANSFSFGLNKDGKYVEYDMLSSGEKCLYMLALMIYILNKSPDKLKLIIVDDMFDHLDNTNMYSIFPVLSEIDSIQFLFAGVNVLPEGYMPNAIEIK